MLRKKDNQLFNPWYKSSRFFLQKGYSPLSPVRFSFKTKKLYRPIFLRYYKVVLRFLRTQYAWRYRFFLNRKYRKLTFFLRLRFKFLNLYVRNLIYRQVFYLIQSKIVRKKFKANISKLLKVFKHYLNRRVTLFKQINVIRAFLSYKKAFIQRKEKKRLKYAFFFLKLRLKEKREPVLRYTRRFLRKIFRKFVFFVKLSRLKRYRKRFFYQRDLRKTYSISSRRFYLKKIHGFFHKNYKKLRNISYDKLKLFYMFNTMNFGLEERKRFRLFKKRFRYDLYRRNKVPYSFKNINRRNKRRRFLFHLLKKYWRQILYFRCFSFIYRHIRRFRKRKRLNFLNVCETKNNIFFTLRIQKSKVYTFTKGRYYKKQSLYKRHLYKKSRKFIYLELLKNVRRFIRERRLQKTPFVIKFANRFSYFMRQVSKKILKSRLKIKYISLHIPRAHNGCRVKKRRRL